MESKPLLKRILIVSTVFTLLALGNALRLKGMETVRAIEVVSLMTLGFGLGALAVCLILYLKGEK